MSAFEFCECLSYNQRTSVDTHVVRLFQFFEEPGVSLSFVNVFLTIKEPSIDTHVVRLFQAFEEP
jgi:hypothetical protein